jgi:hypothetical protein
METQLDYETEPVMAIFHSPEQAHAGMEALQRTLGIPESAIGLVTIDPGRYQAEDGTLAEEGDGVWKGAAVGAPVGALFGIALAVSVPSPGPGVVAGLAVAGAAGVGVLGGFVGAIARARFDDDEAEWIHVTDGRPSLLVAAYSRSPRRAREILRRTGASAFLDCTTPVAAEILRLIGSSAHAATSSAPVEPAPASDTPSAPRSDSASSPASEASSAPGSASPSAPAPPAEGRPP